jgi:predicted GIY-YIG superfamily endonuclease
MRSRHARATPFWFCITCPKRRNNFGRYGLKQLVYCEHFDDIRDALQRESTIKYWPRAWKVRLIDGMNPERDDLYDSLI